MSIDKQGLYFDFLLTVDKARVNPFDHSVLEQMKRAAGAPPQDNRKRYYEVRFTSDRFKTINDPELWGAVRAALGARRNGCEFRLPEERLHEHNVWYEIGDLLFPVTPQKLASKPPWISTYASIHFAGEKERVYLVPSTTTGDKVFYPILHYDKTTSRLWTSRSNEMFTYDAEKALLWFSAATQRWLALAVQYYGSSV